MISLQNSIPAAIITSLLAAGYGVYLIRWISRLPKGTPAMNQISDAIATGAKAYMNRQYTTVGYFAAGIAAVLYFTLGLNSALGFLVGALASSASGYIGMMTAVSSNIRTAVAAKKGLASALQVAFRGGSVTGFLVVGLALLSTTGFYAVTGDLKALIGLAFGGSLISVFARLGGGIYTKGADVGADMVGKVEANIPEDDPRNPSVIADLVGDNVGDCAGMAADLFETYAVTAIAAMLLGSQVFTSQAPVIFPLVLGGASIIASIIGSFFVSLPKSQQIMPALYKGLVASGVVAAILFYPLTMALMAGNGKYLPINIYFATLIGIAVTAAMVLITDYFTSKKYSPVASIATASASGAGTNIIAGLAVSMKSTFVPVLIIALASVASFNLAGLYGIAIAAMSMLSLTGIVVAIHSF